MLEGRDVSEKVILLDWHVPEDSHRRLLIGPWLAASRAPTQWVLHLGVQGVRHHTWIEVCIEELVGDAIARVVHGPVTATADGTLTALLSDFAGGSVRASVSILVSGARRILEHGAPGPLRVAAWLWGD